MLRPLRNTSTVCPLFLRPKPRRPEPLDEELIGFEVECMRVSSRSRTRVFGKWNGVLCVAAKFGGVGDLDAVSVTVASCERRGDEGGGRGEGGGVGKVAISGLDGIAWRSLNGISGDGGEGIEGSGGCASGNNISESSVNGFSGASSINLPFPLLSISAGVHCASVAQRVFQTRTKARTRKRRLRALLTLNLYLERMAISVGGSGGNGRSNGMGKNSEGDEYERFGRGGSWA